MITMYCIKRGWDEHFAVWYASWYENVRLRNDDVRLIVFECGDRKACKRDERVIAEIGEGGIVVEWQPYQWVSVIERHLGRVVTDEDFCIKRSSIDYAVTRLEALDWLSGVCKGDIICHIDLDTLFLRSWSNISNQLRYWVDNGAEMIGVDEWCCSKDYLTDMHPKGWGDDRLFYMNSGMVFFVSPANNHAERFLRWVRSKTDVKELCCLEQDWLNDSNEFDVQRVGVLPSKYNFTWNHLRIQGYGYPVLVHYYGDVKPWLDVPVDDCVWKYGFWEEYLGWLCKVRWLVGGEFYDRTVSRILSVTSELRNDTSLANKGIEGISD